MLRYPDPPRSKVILIGTSDYERNDKLSSLPAIRNNLTGLMEAFTNSTTGAFLPNCCTVVDTPDSPKSLMQRLKRAAGEAEDVLIVYYAGHGDLDWGTKLYLTVRETDPHQLAGTAVPFEWVRDAIQDSPAEIRILILDCCFSGRAIGAMSSESAALEQIRVTGTSILTSTSASEVSHSISGEWYTAFTGELIGLLTEYRDSPLSLGGLYRPLSAAMARRGLPTPRSSIGDSSGSLILRKYSPQQLIINNNVNTDAEPTPFAIPPTWSSRGVPSAQETETASPAAAIDPILNVPPSAGSLANSARHAKLASWLTALSLSVILSGGVFVTGMVQTIRGNYGKDGLGAAIAALIFVICWLLGSICLLARTIRKYRRQHKQSSHTIADAKLDA